MTSSKIDRVRKHVTAIPVGTRFMACDVSKVLDLTREDVAKVLRYPLMLEEGLVRQPRECPSDNHWERIEVEA